MTQQNTATSADSAREQFAAKQAATPGAIVYWKFKAPLDHTLYAIKSIPANDYDDWAAALGIGSTATLIEIIDGYSWAETDAIVDAVVDSYTADGLRADYAGQGLAEGALSSIAGRIREAIKAAS